MTSDFSPTSAPIDRMVALTRDLVQVPSTEHRPEDRHRVFQICRNHLESIPGLRLDMHESGGFESLVAMPADQSTPEILLLGHLDVIDHPDVSVYQSEIQGERIVGPGAGDMKGQCALMIELMRALSLSHPGIPVGIALTSDEERGGEHGTGYLFGEAGLRCGLAIVPDGGSMTDLTVAEKGILHLRLSATGHEGHAARPWLTPNPLLLIQRALAALDTHFSALARPELADHWYPTCVPTICRTRNDTINCIPAEAEAFVDLRFPAPSTCEEMLAEVRRIVGDEVQVEMLVGAESSILSPDPLYLEVTEQLTGSPVRQVRASGGSDARFIAQHGIPVILSRPSVGNLHGTDEWIDIESMGLYFEICRSFMERRLRLGV